MAKLTVPIDSADEHAKELGRLIAHWAVIEHLLVDLLGALLKINQSRAQLIWAEYSAFAVKIRLLRRCTYCYVPDCQQKSDLFKLLGKINDLNDIRNKYVHATWAAGRSDKSLTLIHGTPPSDYKKRVKNAENVLASTLEADRLRIDELYMKILRFVIDELPKMPIHDLPHE